MSNGFVALQPFTSFSGGGSTPTPATDVLYEDLFTIDVTTASYENIIDWSAYTTYKSMRLVLTDYYAVTLSTGLQVGTYLHLNVFDENTSDFITSSRYSWGNSGMKYDSSNYPTGIDVTNGDGSDDHWEQTGILINQIYTSTVIEPIRIPAFIYLGNTNNVLGCPTISMPSVVTPDNRGSSYGFADSQLSGFMWGEADEYNWTKLKLATAQSTIGFVGKILVQGKIT